MNTRSKTNSSNLTNSFIEIVNTPSNYCLTRSKSSTPKLEVKIDFDEASNAWRANKISIGNGSYRYVSTPKPSTETSTGRYNLRSRAK